MVEQFTRVEGTVPESVKEWIELESMRTNTPIKTIVGSAISYYKSQNDNSNLGQRKELLMIGERKCKLILQDLRENMTKNGKNMPDLAQLTHSCAVLLTHLDKSTPKKSRESIKSLYRSVIADYIEAIEGIKSTDKTLYVDCTHILRKSIHKDYIDYFNTLSKPSRGLEASIITSSHVVEHGAPIIYTGGTLDNDSFESEIMEMINNCKTVPPGSMRETKIQDTIYLIQSKYPEDKSDQLIASFLNGIDRMEELH